MKRKSFFIGAGLLSAGLISSGQISGTAANAALPESPTQIRRIVAQSLCLAQAYPETAIAKDAESVYAVYAGLLTVKHPLEARRKIEALAKEADPAKPSPVGDHNLALAKCSLFAERADVQALLGAPSSKRKKK
jgi:hypothetical protein